MAKTEVRNYKQVRKMWRRKSIMNFLLENLLPDFIDYTQLDDLKSFVINNQEECGEYGAFCDYFGLGRWFETAMEDCGFELDEFYHEYAAEIERRAED